MEPFKSVTGVAAPLDLMNVNTDQIFPARFIKKPRSVGYAQFTFHDVRRDDAGEPRPEFPLNQPRFKDASIIVGNENFGCGSSREGAVYTLEESGVRVIIAPSFGDIFAANCMKNGLLTIQLPAETVAELRSELEAADDPTMTVDLEAERITRPSGEALPFQPDSFQKYCLVNGYNEIDLSLEFEADVSAFEQRHRARLPWLAPREG